MNRALSVAVALVAASVLAPAADLVPGLVGEYRQGIADYPSKYPADHGAFLVRVDDQVDFSSVEAQFYGTKLDDDFGVRWSGVLRVPAAGAWTLATESDDGSLLAIDGRPVIDNGGAHGMRRIAATLELTAGDHPLTLEYFEASGAAGCRLLWTPPGAAMELPVPATALWHERGAEAAIAWDQEAWKRFTDRGPRIRSAEMDHGPFLSGTIDSGRDNWAVKGVAFTLDRKREALAVFDVDLLRWATGGVDAYIRQPAGRDGLEGQPKFRGTALFATRQAPGWAAPDGGFADPRPTRAGPLPRPWARFQATWLHGDRAFVSYTVGAATVYDLPALAARDGIEFIARSLAIDGATAPLTTEVCARAGAAGAIVEGAAVLTQGEQATVAVLVGAPAGAALGIDGERVVAVLPPSASPCAIALWSGAAADVARARAALAGFTPEDPRPLTKGGGGRRWGDPVVTAGEVGQGAGAYVVDTLTVPYENPWKAYMRLTGHDFFADGRAAVCTLDGDVWIVSGIDATLGHLVWQRFATGLFQPLGLRIVDGLVYVTCRDGIDRLRDLDGDGEADVVEAFNQDCQVTVNYHEFHLGLETGADGSFYYNMGYPLNSVTTPHQGCVHRVSKDGATLEIVATGLRAPNGLGGGDGLPLTNTDNQGNWMPACRVNLIRPGGFYGMMDSAQREPKPATYDPPILWIPFSVDNSSGGEAWVRDDRWGPLKGTLVHTSYGTSSLFAISCQDLDGVPQGGIVRFPLAFQSGVMRARFAPADGQLYLTGMRGWQTNATREGAFQRVRWTGAKHYQPIGIDILHAGIRLRFAEAVDPELAADVGNYGVERWNYRYSADYGSPELKVSDPKQEGHDAVAIAAIDVGDDGRSLTLRIPDLAPVMQMSVKYKLLAADGADMADQVWLTVNHVPDP